MRHLVFRLLALGLLATASFVHAAWDSQKCDSSKPETTPASRFNTPSAEGTVYDSETKLTWKLCAEGQKYRGSGRCSGEAQQFKWNDAVATFGDKGDGWRMPNIDELRSLIEKRCKKPAVNLGVFPDWAKDKRGSSTFWSSWAWAGYSDAWYVDFDNGNSFSYSKSYSDCVRLVRGGQFFDSSEALAEQKEALAEELRRKQQELVEAEHKKQQELVEAERKKQQDLAEAERKKQQELAEAERRKQQELVEAERRKQQALAEAQRKAEEQRKEQQYQSTLNGPSPRAMYLLAAQLEDQDKEDKAKALYRKIMSAFPDSDFAIKAGDRLTQLRDVGNIADGAKRAAERVAESNRQDAERAGNEQRARQSRNCESSHSQCMAMCNGMSDSYGKWGGTPPRTTCKWDCDHARSACR